MENREIGVKDLECPCLNLILCKMLQSKVHGWLSTDKSIAASARLVIIFL